MSIKRTIIENPLFGIALREEIGKIGLKISEFAEPVPNLTIETATAIASDHSSSAPSVKAADQFLTANRHQLSKETIGELLKNPGVTLLRKTVERDLSGLKLTPQTHQAIKEKIDLYNIPNLKEKYKAYAQKSLMSSGQTEDMKLWLEICYKNFDKDCFENIIDSFLCVENMREVFAFADEKNLESIRALCKEYCVRHNVEIKEKGIWPIDEVPEFLAPILYPISETRHVWE